MPFALLGLALAWSVMLLFGGLEFDRGLLVFAYAGRHPALVETALWITQLGDAEIVLLASGGGALLLLVRREWRLAALLVGITLSGRLLVEAQKGWAARLRPEANDHLVAVQNYAFPSGHAANATLVWLCLALMLPRGSRSRFHAVWAAACVALAVGVSRVMLGVHWPSDVIGGWAFGLFWLLLMFGLARQPLDEGRRAAAGHSSSESAEEAHEIGSGGDEGDAVTRAQGADKPHGGDRPSLPNRS
jgi:membrane-associated phospholipid phosphatase